MTTNVGSFEELPTPARTYTRVETSISPANRIRAEIGALLASECDLASTLEDVARLTVRLMMQTAIEAEVDEFLGRARYERRGDEDRPGSRNGHQPPTAVKTTMGPIELQRPKAPTRRSAPACSASA
jgi:hypothetical protein